MLVGCPTAINPIVFASLDADSIRHAALRTKGAAGISGLDAHAWRRLCSSFKLPSNDLCVGLAAVGRRIATESVYPDGLSAFVTCRLVPLNKCPGVKFHDVLFLRLILKIVDPDIQESVDPLQVCASRDGDCEAAIHSMNHIYSDPTTEAVLLADASNA